MFALSSPAVAEESAVLGETRYGALVPEIRRAIQDVDPEIPIHHVTS